MADGGAMVVFITVLTSAGPCLWRYLLRDLRNQPDGETAEMPMRAGFLPFWSVRWR
jgi:hypothetical protein